MKNAKKLMLAAACCVGSLAATNVAQAGLSQMEISYYTTYGATVIAQGYNHSTYATAFSADWIGGASLPAGHTDPFITFCLDINNILGNGWWESGGFSDVPLNNDSNPADRVETGLYRAASLYQHYVPSGITSASDKLTGAALQLAIWEVLYEKGGVGYSIDQNNAIADGSEFYVSSVNADVRTLANTMLSSQWNVEDHNLEYTFWNAVLDEQGGYRSSQDLIGPNPSTTIPVPEPSSMIAGALLLLPFGASALRILRKQKAA